MLPYPRFPSRPARSYPIGSIPLRAILGGQAGASEPSPPLSAIDEFDPFLEKRISILRDENDMLEIIMIIGRYL